MRGEGCRVRGVGLGGQNLEEFGIELGQPRCREEDDHLVVGNLIRVSGLGSRV